MPELRHAARLGEDTFGRGRITAMGVAMDDGTLERRAMGAEQLVAAKITEECFYSLEAPVLRVAGMDVPYPPSRLEEDYLPDLDRVLDAVDRSLAY